MPSIYRMGDLTLDVGRQELRRGAERVHLGPLTWRLLLTLIEAAPDVATYDEIAAAVWDGRAVSPETIAQRVKLLREAIGDDAHDPRYIELLRGRGCRLIPPVMANTAGGARKRWNRAAAAVGAILAMSLATTAVLLFTQSDHTTPAPDEAASYSRTRIAVLPFEDFSSGQDQQFLADGIAETLLQSLTQVDGLQVIARSSSFSYRGRDVASVARDLEVGTVLEGSVQRVGNRLRVTARLVRTSDQSHVWSLTFDRHAKDIFAIQDEIAARVVDALVERTPQAITRELAETSPEAYDRYLKGRELWKTGGEDAAGEAIALLEETIEHDPRFAPAHSELATVLYLFGSGDDTAPEELSQRIEREIELALGIDPNDAQAYAIRGLVQADRWRFDEALADLNRAAALRPKDVLIQRWLGLAHQQLGDHATAARHLGNAFRLDPLNLIARFSYTDMLIVLSPDDAVSVARQTTSLFPANADAWLSLGTVYFFQRRYSDEILALAEGLGYVDDPAPLVQDIATTFNRLKDFEAADRWRRRAEALTPEWKPFVHWYVTRGDGAGFVATARRQVEQFPDMPVWKCVLALGLMYAGREEEAWNVTSETLDDIPERARNEVAGAFWDCMMVRLWLARRRGNDVLAMELDRQGRDLIERRVESGHAREANMMYIFLNHAAGRPEAAGQRLTKPNFLHPNADTFIEHDPQFADIRETPGGKAFLQNLRHRRAAALAKLRDAGIPWLFEPEKWQPPQAAEKVSRTHDSP